MSTPSRSTQIQIDLPAQAIVALCQRYPIRELALFGSVLRPEFGPESDIDMLVQFKSNAKVGYLRFFQLQDELTAVLKREVDLFTPNSLKPFARETALRDKVTIYAS